MALDNGWARVYFKFDIIYAFRGIAPQIQLIHFAGMLNISIVALLLLVINWQRFGSDGGFPKNQIN